MLTNHPVTFVPYSNWDIFLSHFLQQLLRHILVKFQALKRPNYDGINVLVKSLQIAILRKNMESRQS